MERKSSTTSDRYLIDSGDVGHVLVRNWVIKGFVGSFGGRVVSWL